MTRDELWAGLFAYLTDVYGDSSPAVPKALLAAVRLHIENAGYVVAPVEPTEAMLAAFNRARVSGIRNKRGAAVGAGAADLYKAMLKAAEA